MAIGKSYRIVIEVDPDKKEQFYAALKLRGLTMREWFLRQAESDLLKKNSKTKEK